MDEPELKSLLAAMITDARYVCDFVSVAWPEGATPRGRAATVQCGVRFFRVEVWQDKSTFTVVPAHDPRG